MEVTREEANACRRLWLWVMITALRELGSEDKAVQEDAERWVLGDGFSWVCELFHINPDEAREFVKKNYWKRGIAEFPQDMDFGVNLGGRFKL